MGVLSGCKPRAEVLQGDLDDAIFAADFGDVVADRGPAVYRDARTFFRNTHPAERLKKLVETVFGRLNDPRDAGVTIRLSTGFGGGKTHTLIALFHLAKGIADPSLGTELLPAAGRPRKVKVVALDAQKGGAHNYSAHEGRQVNSLWGEVFYQLGGLAALDALGAADDPESSPSESQIESALPDGPLLFLLDELVIYMARLSERGQGNGLGFLQSLMSVVAKRPQTALLVTDPADQRAYAREAAQLGNAVDAAGMKLDSVYGRKVSDFNPIEGEVARVIVRRLFDEVDASAAQRTSATYHELFKPGRTSSRSASGSS
jgi:predicted AAA+ superfamily ATPase